MQPQCGVLKPASDTYHLCDLLTGSFKFPLSPFHHTSNCLVWLRVKGEYRKSYTNIQQKGLLECVQ